uniref:Uncharacterized protein n=1 Tax=Romanomermis culicivorax TaxID=13658 RepID=A0A915JX84_ROMCU
MGRALLDSSQCRTHFPDNLPTQDWLRFRATGLYPINVNEPLSKVQNLSQVFGERESETESMDVSDNMEQPSSSARSKTSTPSVAESSTSFEKSIVSFLSYKFSTKKSNKNRRSRVLHKYGKALTSAEVVSRLKQQEKTKK